MFNIGIDEIILICLIFIIFVEPKKWKTIFYKTGKMINKIKQELDDLKK